MDRTEYCRLVGKYYDDVKRVAFAGCRNLHDAEDITQTVFMKLLNKTETFEDDEHLKKWLIRVAVNEYRSLWRSPWKQRTDFFLPERSAGFGAQDEDRSQVIEAVLKLDRKYREVIHLFYYEEYSAREIGEMLGISEGTVFKRLERARNRLRDRILNDEGSFIGGFEHNG